MLLAAVRQLTPNLPLLHLLPPALRAGPLCVGQGAAAAAHSTFSTLASAAEVVSGSGATVAEAGSIITGASVAAAVTGSSSDKFRRGRSGEFALPLEKLREVIVSSAHEPVPLTLQAYHVGSRIHIGATLSRLKDLHPSFNSTTHGKDWAIVFFKDLLESGTSPLQLKKFGMPLWVLQWLSTAAGVIRPAGSQAGHDKVVSLTPENRLFQAFSDLVGSRASDQAPTGTGPLQAAVDQTPPQQQQQQEEQQQQVHSLLPFMAVYRSGSVVFCGTEEREELLWLGHVVPPAVRYSKEERPPSWAKAGLQKTLGDFLPSTRPKETQTVVVDSGCPDVAQQSTNEVRLRVLDVGAAHVLTSVLAQSAALHFYEESVRSSLEHLADWRAAHSGPRASRSVLLPSKHDTVQFKIIAASVLIMNEAQELVAMAEPAWQYDTYNKIWMLMADHYELEERLQNLTAKLDQAEDNAKYDIKLRAGRRTSSLEHGLIMLLIISCILVACEVGMKVWRLVDASSSSDSSILEAAAAADADAAVVHMSIQTHAGQEEP